MNSFPIIQNKLERFIQKYYTNELIRGVILFFAIGLLYFFLTLFIEYILWLKPTARTILFWVFIGIELVLFSGLIVSPLFKLIKLKKGLDQETASKIIGKYFPEVSDKLLNVLQLYKNKAQSELLIASIEQKSLELKPIPFVLAVNFKSNLKYLKYVLIPIFIIIISFVFGKQNWFSDSYTRVVNYQTAYSPPAPFKFFIVNQKLSTIENKKFTLLVATEGETIPEDVEIQFNEQSYVLKKRSTGEFEYTFENPKADIVFTLRANTVVSKTHVLEVIKTPSLLSLEMILDYPSYTKKKDEVIINAGDAVVPLGTKIAWKLNTKSTENVTLISRDSIYELQKNNSNFTLSKQVFKSMRYSINTSNQNLKNYESLDYKIEVIRDEYPELNVQMKKDSLDNETLYFFGNASDDYGLQNLNLVYYSTEAKAESRVNIPVANSNFTEFLLSFPDQITLEEGKSYELYFEIYDNDIFHNYKKTKSIVYSYRKQTQDELEQNQLEEQSQTIEDIEKTLDRFNQQDEELKKLSQTQKEKTTLSFSEKQKLQNFLKRQKQQEEMMQKFNKELKDNLEEFNNEEQDNFKEELKKRLEDNQEQLKKDEKLLKELEKLAEKINKEELSNKLDQLAKKNMNKKRSLEQLLELTKRYYVSQKTEQLKNKLSNLAEKQEKLAETPSEENTKKSQDKLNKEFEELQKELEDLRKENAALRKPMKVPNDKSKEEQIKKDQKEASENLQQKEQSEDQKKSQELENSAKKKQKKAAQQMKQLSEQMNQMMMGGGGAQLSEDIDMLRQILDNLVLFSFDQEDLMKKFRSMQVNHKEYAKALVKQQNLKEHFEHIDDSLFAMSLRNPQISEKINTEITEVYYNIDKALAEYAENKVNQGVAAQQYAITASNTLASYLSDVLDNMEMQMNPSNGQGEMQLPDIILSQEQLNKQMEEGLKKKDGQDQNEKEGSKKKDGQGQEDKDGEQSKRGQSQSKSQNEEAKMNQELQGELFEIYKKQQQLRKALEDKISKEGKTGNADQLLKEMEEIELDLINKGFTKNTLQKMQQLQYQLLKLENATFQQGKDKKRKSKTNTKSYSAQSNILLKKAKGYFTTNEILDRNPLPLNYTYKKKVQDYFKQIE